jgi:hypothetical protein
MYDRAQTIATIKRFTSGTVKAVLGFAEPEYIRICRLSCFTGKGIYSIQRGSKISGRKRRERRRIMDVEPSVIDELLLQCPPNLVECLVEQKPCSIFQMCVIYIR